MLYLPSRCCHGGPILAHNIDEYLTRELFYPVLRSDNSIFENFQSVDNLPSSSTFIKEKIIPDCCLLRETRGKVVTIIMAQETVFSVNVCQN